MSSTCMLIKSFYCIQYFLLMLSGDIITLHNPFPPPLFLCFEVSSIVSCTSAVNITFSDSTSRELSFKLFNEWLRPISCLMLTKSTSLAVYTIIQPCRSTVRLNYYRVMNNVLTPCHLKNRHIKQ